MKPSSVQETQSKNLNEFGTDATEQSSTLKIKLWIKARMVICASPLHRGLTRFAISKALKIIGWKIASKLRLIAHVKTVMVTEGSNCFYTSYWRWTFFSLKGLEWD